MPISEELPCGEDLEYDPVFGEMERAAQGKGDQQFGETFVAAEAADWREVRKHVDDLLPRTKDMRVAVYLTRCLAQSDGLVGVESSLKLLRCYLEDFWEPLHPQLDASDNDDPTYRVNTLAMLCDTATVLNEIQACSLVSSRAMGQYGLLQIREAGETHEHEPVEPQNSGWADDDSADADEEEPKGPSLAVIAAAFTDADPAVLQATEEAVRLSAEHVGAIEYLVTQKVGAAQAVSMKPLRSLFEEMLDLMQPQLERLGIGIEEEFPELVAENVGDDATDQVAMARHQGIQLDGRISTRADAIKALDKVCEYFETSEPSSPLPLLLRRAQRLASKSFLEIIRDLAPDALSQAEAWGGGAGPILEGNAEEAVSYEEQADSSEEDTSSSGGW